MSIKAKLTKQELIERHDEEYLVSVAMMVYGGGFCQQLAKLIQMADQSNMQKIKDTWPEYWQQYLDMHIQVYNRDGRIL